MTEPAVTPDIPRVRVIPEDEMTPQEWADEQAVKAGRLWESMGHGPKDW